jgi:hypothetical protein
MAGNLHVTGYCAHCDKPVRSEGFLFCNKTCGHFGASTLYYDRLAEVQRRDGWDVTRPGSKRAKSQHKAKTVEVWDKAAILGERPPNVREVRAA